MHIRIYRTRYDSTKARSVMQPVLMWQVFLIIITSRKINVKDSAKDINTSTFDMRVCQLREGIDLNQPESIISSLSSLSPHPNFRNNEQLVNDFQSEPKHDPAHPCC
jgi:hypothetical protein